MRVKKAAWKKGSQSQFIEMNFQVDVNEVMWHKPIIITMPVRGVLIIKQTFLSRTWSGNGKWMKIRRIRDETKERKKERQNRDAIKNVYRRIK